MHNVIDHIRAVPEHREAFESAFRASLKHMDGFGGLVRVDAWRAGPAMMSQHVLAFSRHPKR